MEVSNSVGAVYFGVVLRVLYLFPFLLSAALCLPESTLGQESRSFEIIEDGELADLGIAFSDSSTSSAVVNDVIAYYVNQGYLFVKVENGSDSQEGSIRVEVTKGSALTVRSVDVRTDSDWDLSDFVGTMQTRTGRTFVPRELDADLNALLSHLSRNGAVRTTVSLDSLSISSDSAFVEISILAKNTQAPVVASVTVNEDSRTNSKLIARIAELKVGTRMGSFDSDRIKDRLLATEFVQDVGDPELLVDESNAVEIFIPIEDAPPGKFDLVLGYLPASGSQSSGSIVGSGKLDLVNIFGGGRRFALTLNRLPGQVASVRALAADPFVAGWPVGIEFRFDGYQQDSTFSRQNFAAEGSYLLATGLRTTVSISRENTRPGQAGLVFVGDEQRIPRASGIFLGVGARYRNLDFAPNPRRGIILEMNFERGRSTRESSIISNADTTMRSLNVRQQRLHILSRVVVPTVRRQAAVVGVDALVLLANDFRDSDLFRYGGAATLRGYNEEQFRGNFVGRFVFEYRYQIDRTSYAFFFTDMGLVQVPSFDDVPESRTFHPGFGLGIQFETAIGFINTTYALNNVDGPANGRLHIGLSFGL